jgi:dienelactone hydrolase
MRRTTSICELWLDSVIQPNDLNFRRMKHLPRARLFCSAPIIVALAANAQDVLPGTQPLSLQGDFSAQMVSGIDKFFTRQTEQSLTGREQYWHRDFSSPAAYDASVQPNRERLRKMIGVVDERVPVAALDFVSSTVSPAKVGETASFTAKAVRWPVFEGVTGEGLFLEPKGPPVACVVAIPDADQTPEMLVGLAPGLAPERQFARRLAENGCEVLVPVLINRQDTWSSRPNLNRLTNLPHREWIYKQAYPLGRHIIGYEVQKVAGAVGFLEIIRKDAAGKKPKIGVAGYGEGGLIAFYAAALDRRIDAALVSGYFDSRQHLWEEPIYRNVFGLLREFGDAEIASLVAPRALIVEYSKAPQVDGPPKPRTRKPEAAPGRIKTPDYSVVEAEFERARTLLQPGDPKQFDRFKLISGTEGMLTGPGSDRALSTLLKELDVSVEDLKPAGPRPSDLRGVFDPDSRQQRQLLELENYTQKLLRESERERVEFFWQKVQSGSVHAWETSCVPFKQILWDEFTGRLSSPALSANPRSRLWDPAAADPASASESSSPNAAHATNQTWAAYEVVLDVYRDVFAWGILLVPKDLKPGERRPVVVCQHGLEGVPADVITQVPTNAAFHYYIGYAARLADRGFVVFAPHNPYRGEASFRQLQRKANPLKASLFSVIIAQHNCILDWLQSLPFVDPKRIGLYGLSYGGTTAMRVPAVLDRYALSICSGSFNDWTRKTVATDSSYSYVFLGEYEVPDFNLGETFSHAEMAALIAPRPFMVERGHDDPVGTDEWVAGEYAKVRRLYDRLGIGDRTTIEFFNGGHAIHAEGTFDFLHHHLGWPKPSEPRSSK